MDIEVTSQTPPSKRRRVLAVRPTPRLSDLLASFGAQKSPESASRMQRQAAGREMRATKTVDYAESDSASPESSPDSQSSFEEAESSRTSMPPDSRSDSEDEEQSDGVVHVASRPAGTRTLPPRSTRSTVSYAKPVKKPKKKGMAKSKRSFAKLLASDTSGQVGPQQRLTARSEIRGNINSQTKPKRDAFLLAEKEAFLAVLPEKNYIRKLEVSESISKLPAVVEYASMDQQPSAVQATLKSYQLEGLSFLVNRFHNGMPAILGDEMGLGKTLQTLSLFEHLAEKEPAAGEPRPHLVVCPLSVLSSWMAEARKWTPGLKVVRFHGPHTEREKLKKELLLRFSNSGLRNSSGDASENIDIVVTTYQTFKAESGWFKRAFAWRYCVLDEGHLIKNHESQMASTLFSLQAEYRLLLTGTPLQNNLKEMWALLHWLLPDVFPAETAIRFKEAFDLGAGKVSSTFLDHARELLEILMLRRTKSEVELGLPPKEEVLLYVPLTPMQRFWYTRLLTKSDNATLEDLFKDAKGKASRDIKLELDGDQKLSPEYIDNAAMVNVDADAAGDEVWAETMQLTKQSLEQQRDEPKTGHWKKLMNLVMQLQRLCCHPYLLKPCVPNPYTLGEHVKAASGKFVVLDKLVDELTVKQRKKILIFSRWTKALDVCEDLLTFKGANTNEAPFRYLRLDGSTGRARRNLAIRCFNDRTSDFRIMLVSTRAGGLGLNLTAATSVIFLDEDWNPQVTVQAEARSHRIGQTEKVTIYKIITQGTVEEQMMGRIRKKLFLSAKITESMRNVHSQQVAGSKRKRTSQNAADEDEPALGASQLRSLLRKGAQTLARPEVDMTAMMGWDFDTMIRECKDKDDSYVADSAAGVSETEEQAWLNTMEKVETAVFEGKKHQREIEKQAVQDAELARTDRRVGKHTTVMIDGFAINKESLSCADWEAVPTMAGKDPRLAEPIRAKKEAISNQEFCQHCWDGGKLILCSGCPRSYHAGCLDEHFKAKSLSHMQFHCPSHECVDCQAKTAEAGGMIYRCRWCEKGYCEDCLDWDVARLVGESLPEYEMLGFRPVTQAWYIECPTCITGGDRQTIMQETARINVEYQKFLRQG